MSNQTLRFLTFKVRRNLLRQPNLRLPAITLFNGEVVRIFEVGYDATDASKMTREFISFFNVVGNRQNQRRIPGEFLTNPRNAFGYLLPKQDAALHVFNDG